MIVVEVREETVRFNTLPEEDYSLSLTALIDVVFLLLIFFMVSTAFIDFTRRMDIRLPEAEAGATTGERTRQFLIEIGKNGLITLNGQGVSLPSLESQLRRSLGKESKTALVRADRGLPYGLIVRVMGICRAAGIVDIGVAVKGSE